MANFNRHSYGFRVRHFVRTLNRKDLSNVGSFLLGLFTCVSLFVACFVLVHVLHQHKHLSIKRKASTAFRSSVCACLSVFYVLFSRYLYAYLYHPCMLYAWHPSGCVARFKKVVRLYSEAYVGRVPYSCVSSVASNQIVFHHGIQLLSASFQLLLYQLPAPMSS